jgi:N-acetylglucosaminyldiphosphoundecaprenol N-acetyl-beta-D-mannosaminyltransferase
MPFVAVLVAVAAALWGAVYARRGSLLIGCGLVVFVSYVLGHQFWNAQLGPLPLTLDRLLLLGLVAALAVRWRAGTLPLRPLTASDWTLVAALALVTISALLSGQPEITDGVTSKWGRLLASFIIPTALFFVIRHTPITERESRWLLAGLTLFGVYLAGTAFCEKAGLWSFVFPRYIANPNLGIHFGRARGPELNSVSLGMYLTACICCAWMLLRVSRNRWLQLAVAATLPLMAAGVYFTYTRSTWLGLAASGAIIAAIEIPRRWRVPAFALAGLCGVLVLATTWSHVLDIKREGSVGDSEHSVDQRKSFAYVSWNMFREDPIFGVGFGRFYDQKMPYLSDRSQHFELESIRGLHHHNTLLSVLTEMGLVGITAFFAMIAAWSLAAWRLVQSKVVPRCSRVLGILMLALLANYFCSALFHDLTLLPSQQVLLFAFAAIAVNVGQPALLAEQSSCRSYTTWNRWWNELFPRTEDAIQPAQSTSHVPLFGMQINRIAMDETVTKVLGWCDEPRGSSCRYVVTPNVDHAVLYQERADVRAAYADAALVLADGAPIVLASRLLRRPLPERVAGSDLVPQIFDSASKPLKVFLLGAAPGVAEVAAARIESRWPNVKVVGCYSPPLGFEYDDAENNWILATIAESQADLVVVGFGAPKQELWVHAHSEALHAKVVLCAGATIDFLAGNRERSPVWMRRAGLEWLHRLATEPRRLAGRYARDAWIFPRLVWREWRSNA